MSASWWPAHLQHGEVVLRPLRRRDRAAWEEVREYNQDWLRPWEATKPPGADPGPATFAALVRLLDQNARNGTALPWALCWDPTGGKEPGLARLVGQLTVSGIVRGSAMLANVGYWIDRRTAGRGIVPTGLAMATDFCFGELGLHRMEVAIRPENGNSLRVVQKLGFRHEGLRPRFLHINGEWRDHEIFALHREEVPGGLLARFEATQPGPSRAG